MDNEDDLLSHFLALYAKAAVCNVAELRREAETNVGTRLNCPTVPRARKSVHQVYREMGKTYFRRSCRMTYSAFCCLLRLTKPGLQEAFGSNKRQPGYVNCSPNGSINLATRLAVAIRFFAGGEAYDIYVMFGIFQTSVFDSIDAVGRCSQRM